jgi:hypothetical protein
VENTANVSILRILEIPKRKKIEVLCSMLYPIYLENRPLKDSAILMSHRREEYQ